MPQLAELDYDHTWHENERAGDSKLYVYFFEETLPDPDASERDGIRRFRDATMIHIQVPGDRNNIVVREAREDDKQRFEKQYSKYQEGKTDQQSGFPLKEWPLISRSVATELKFLGFHTVEQVASASDNQIKYPGLREISRRAKTWLEAQQGAAPLEKMATELEKRDSTIKALQDQVAELTKNLAILAKK